MMIPQHVWSYIQRVEVELQKRYEQTKSENIRSALRSIKSTKELLLMNQDASERGIGKEDWNESMFKIFTLLKTVYEKCEYLVYPELENAKCEVTIDPNLVMALNATALPSKSSKLQEKARQVKRFLFEGTPNEVWTSYDEIADYRVFQYISTVGRWRYILQKNRDAYDITGDFKKIKMACLITETPLSEKIELLGFHDMKAFHEKFHEKSFEAVAKKWLRVGITCTYYIYVPS